MRFLSRFIERGRKWVRMGSGSAKGLHNGRTHSGDIEGLAGLVVFGCTFLAAALGDALKPYVDTGGPDLW